ncbi:MAG: hypothetical protein Q7U10_00565 [Thermodesulfovibrionia bacterium]|nr:hypothetical protein [Thermodesulfovibrionia bacterium]
MKKIYLLLMIMAIFTAGCGKDEVKPSYDSAITLNALQTVNKIKEAYMAKDTATLGANMNKELYDGISDKLVFEKADLSFSTPRIVRISDPDVKVLLNWQCEWTVDGTMLRDRGVSTLVFNVDTMKLVRIEGASPFNTPGMK